MYFHSVNCINFQRIISWRTELDADMLMTECTESGVLTVVLKMRYNRKLWQLDNDTQKYVEIHVFFSNASLCRADGVLKHKKKW